MTTDEIGRQTSENFRRFFRLNERAISTQKEDAQL